MKKLLLPLLILTLSATVAQAGLRTLGKGATLTFDSSNFPPQMKADYDNVVKVKCIKCHTLERLVIAVQTGIAPISGQPFDRNATRAYGIKMLRKPDSNMTKAQVKQAVEVMNYLLQQAGN